MRELEFLPDWYPQLRQRKRLVWLQTWMTLVIILGLSLWFGLARRNVLAAEQTLSSLGVQMDQTRNEQQQLNELLKLRKELQQREQIVAKLGFPVEMSRLLRTLDEVMPREMSIIEIHCNTEESVIAPTGAEAAQAVPPSQRPIDRRLKIRLVGVAPNDVDLANFLAGLTAHDFIENIALLRADGRAEGGHLMREFEVTFLISLNTGGAS
jgi:Tfp pilus assembly protein PilN